MFLATISFTGHLKRQQTESRSSRSRSSNSTKPSTSSYHAPEPVTIDSSQNHSPEILSEQSDDPLAEENDDEKSDIDANTETPSKKRKRENRPDFSIRFDGKGHLPAKENWDNATRCKLESCKKKSHVYCTKCNVHLCLEAERNCFLKFHQITTPE